MIKIKKTKNHKEKPRTDELGFGKYFSDHMFVMDYDKNKGWYNPKIVPFDNLLVNPSLSTLHYGQSVFEGMKAYLNNHNEVVLFRPKENAKRFKKSCIRMAMPTIEEDVFVEAVSKLVAIDKDWIPKDEGTSLYIRPFMYATDEVLGVRTSNTYKFIIILSPVGHYYSNGLKPISIRIDNKYSRTFFGGTGDVKCSANYAISLLAQKEASEKGYDQVLWLGGKEHNILSEVGAMNIFFVIEDKIYTPKLDGTVLPGITRDSVIQLLKMWGHTVLEEDLTVLTLIDKLKYNRVNEIFGTGTAATISPIGLIEYAGIEYEISRDIGEISQRLYDSLNRIRTIKGEQYQDWIQVVQPLESEYL